MIDIFNMVFDKVFDAVKAVDDSADIMDVPADMFAKYPAVTVRETNNVPLKRMNTDDCAENYSRLSYEIRIYCNDLKGAKSHAKEIFQAVDAKMQEMKFYRTMKRELPNQDRTVFVIYGRWEVVVGQPQEIDGNTVYQMYRG